MMATTICLLIVIAVTKMMMKTRAFVMNLVEANYQIQRVINSTILSKFVLYISVLLIIISHCYIIVVDYVMYFSSFTWSCPLST